MYNMESYMHSECALWKPLIWPGQRSCTCPIFQLHPTLDLNYNCAKFHHSTSTRSWVMVKTDRQTDIQDDRISIPVKYLIMRIQYIHIDTCTYIHVNVSVIQPYLTGTCVSPFAIDPVSHIYNLCMSIVIVHSPYICTFYFISYFVCYWLL